MAKMRADSEKNLKNEENQEKQVSFLSFGATGIKKKTRLPFFRRKNGNLLKEE